MNSEGWKKLTLEQRIYNVKFWILQNFKHDLLSINETISFFDELKNLSNLNLVAEKSGYLNDV